MTEPGAQAARASGLRPHGRTAGPQARADYIAVMTRIKDIDPALASKIRKAAHRGLFTEEQTAKVVVLLRNAPMKEES